MYTCLSRDPHPPPETPKIPKDCLPIMYTPHSEACQTFWSPHGGSQGSPMLRPLVLSYIQMYMYACTYISIHIFLYVYNTHIYIYLFVCLFVGGVSESNGSSQGGPSSSF